MENRIGTVYIGQRCGPYQKSSTRKMFQRFLGISIGKSYDDGNSTIKFSVLRALPRIQAFFRPVQIGQVLICGC